MTVIRDRNTRSAMRMRAPDAWRGVWTGCTLGLVGPRLARTVRNEKIGLISHSTFACVCFVSASGSLSKD